MLKLKINKEKLLNDVGLEFRHDYDILLYLIKSVDYLETHNKNYTQRQYQQILDIKYILDSLEIR